MRTPPIDRYPRHGVLFPGIVVWVRSPKHHAQLERYEMVGAAVTVAGFMALLIAAAAVVAWGFWA